MFPKGFPRNPGELAISPLTRAETRSPRETRGGHVCGRAVLRTHSTDEGGEPQGFRKERPRYPLEGRGEQADESVERKHSRGSDLGRYVHANRQTNRPDHDGLGTGGESRLRNPLREICTVGSARGGDVSEAMVDLNAHEAGNGG
jgi:hypothetical protein